MHRLSDDKATKMAIVFIVIAIVLGIYLQIRLITQ